MQLRIPVITTALLLATSAAAASAGSLRSSSTNSLLSRELADNAMLVRAVPGLDAVKGSLGTIAKSATSNIKGDGGLLRKLNSAKAVKPAQVKPVITKLGKHFSQTGTQISRLASTVGHSNNQARDLMEIRQDGTLQAIIAALTDGLDGIIPEVVTLLQNVLSALGLDGVNDLIDELLPGVNTLQDGLEQLLTAVGDALAPIVNPLLSAVQQLLDTLLGDVTSILTKRGPAALPAAQAVNVNKLGAAKSGLSNNKAAVKSLVAQGTNASPAAGKKVIGSLINNVKAATAAINAINHGVATQSPGAARFVAADSAALATLERRLVLPDLGSLLSGLITDLNALLPGVDTLLSNLLSSLGLDSINSILDELTPALTLLVLGIEALLEGVADVLAPIVDPLLAALNEIIANLGSTIGDAI
ncbi:hypothetical protein V8E36_001671 [Tilletia maclaganii]